MTSRFDILPTDIAQYDEDTIEMVLDPADLEWLAKAAERGEPEREPAVTVVAELPRPQPPPALPQAPPPAAALAAQPPVAQPPLSGPPVSGPLHSATGCRPAIAQPTFSPLPVTRPPVPVSSTLAGRSLYRPAEVAKPAPPQLAPSQPAASQRALSSPARSLPPPAPPEPREPPASASSSAARDAMPALHPTTPKVIAAPVAVLRSKISWAVVVLGVAAICVLSGGAAYLTTTSAPAEEPAPEATPPVPPVPASPREASPAIPDSSPDSDAQILPIRYANPFDATEVFEFPPGTTETEARDAVADMLLNRARERMIRSSDRRDPGKAPSGDRENRPRVARRG